MIVFIFLTFHRHWKHGSLTILPVHMTFYHRVFHDLEKYSQPREGQRCYKICYSRTHGEGSPNYCLHNPKIETKHISVIFIMSKLQERTPANILAACFRVMISQMIANLLLSCVRPTCCHSNRYSPQGRSYDPHKKPVSLSTVSELVNSV